MTYKVLLVPAAIADLEEHAERIKLDSPTQAKKWLTEAWKLILSLDEMPGRHEVCIESPIGGLEIRDVAHYSHRIVYSIDDVKGAVTIFRVWHMARRPLSERDISQPS